MRLGCPVFFTDGVQWSVAGMVSAWTTQRDAGCAVLATHTRVWLESRPACDWHVNDVTAMTHASSAPVH